MNPDFRTGQLAGWNGDEALAAKRAMPHLDENGPWILVYCNQDGQTRPFTRDEIAELVELAEQAWPGLAGELAVAAMVRKAVDNEETER